MLQNIQIITKQCKKLKDIEIRSFCPPLSFMKTVKEAMAVCRSFLAGVVIFKIWCKQLFKKCKHAFEHG